MHPSHRVTLAKQKEVLFRERGKKTRTALFGFLRPYLLGSRCSEVSKEDSESKERWRADSFTSYTLLAMQYYA